MSLHPQQCSVVHLMENIVKETLSFYRYFNFIDFVDALVFKLLIPLFDIITDFDFAESLKEIRNETLRKWYTFMAYYFISLPGLMILLSIIGDLRRGGIYAQVD